MNEPTNQPTTHRAGCQCQTCAPATLVEMLRKAIGAERAAIVRYMRAHSDVNILELATAIESCMHGKGAAQ